MEHYREKQKTVPKIVRNVFLTVTDDDDGNDDGGGDYATLVILVQSTDHVSW